MVKKNYFILLTILVFVISLKLIFAQYTPPGGGYTPPGGGYAPPGGTGGYTGGGTYVSTTGTTGTGSYSIYQTQQGTYNLSVPLSTDPTSAMKVLKETVFVEIGDKYVFLSETDPSKLDSQSGLFIKLADGSYQPVKDLYITDIHGTSLATDSASLTVPYIWLLKFGIPLETRVYNPALNGLTYNQNFNLGFNPNKIGEYKVEVDGREYWLAFEWLSGQGFSFATSPEDISDGITVGELFLRYADANPERSRQWIISQKEVVVDSPVSKTDSKTDKEKEIVKETILTSAMKVFAKLSINLADNFLPKSPVARSGFSNSYRSDSGARELRTVNNKPVVTEHIFPKGLTSYNRQAWSDVNTVTNDGKDFMIIATRSSDGKRVGFYLTEAQFVRLPSDPNLKTSRNPVISLAVNVKKAEDKIQVSALNFLDRFGVIEKTEKKAADKYTNYEAIGRYNRIKKSKPPKIEIDELVSIDNNFNTRTQLCPTTIDLSDVKRIRC